MAAYSEVADALDEICDETINIDDKGQYMKIIFENAELSVDERSDIEKEFDKYVEFFDLKNKGWQYFRQLLVKERYSLSLFFMKTI